MFDVISGTFSEHISTDSSAAELTLTLLQNALRHEPGQLVNVLHTFVSLPDQDRDNLARLLESVSMENVIRSASSIADRNRMLVALEHLIYDPTDSKLTNERDHLHKILENEL